MSGQRVERMVKLVRSKAGQLWKATAVEFRPVRDGSPEHVKLLRQKLIEEAAEYVTDPSLGELADVFDVIEALLARDLDCTSEDLWTEIMKRRQERGSYIDGMTMWMTGELNEGKVPDDQARVIDE